MIMCKTEIMQAHSHAAYLHTHTYTHTHTHKEPSIKRTCQLRPFPRK